MWFICVSCVIALYFIYDGYLRVLQIASSFAKKKTFQEDESSPHTFPYITVLITVFNEESTIGQRLENLVDCQYPKDKLTILVASDGSEDDTGRIVRQYRKKDSRIHLFEGERRGKTFTQNEAMKLINSEIVIFTDAETLFDRGALKELVIHFKDQAVGAVTGALRFNENPGSKVSKNQGYYWNYELKLRELESKIGILAISTGACLALRRKIFRPIEAAYGEDCIVPLDVALKGYRVKHAADAIAYDDMPSEAATELRARVRMTLRNWQGTWSRPQLLNPFRFPGYATALWSHKILRWLSPFFLIGFTVSALVLIPVSPLFFVLGSGVMILYGLGILGWLTHKSEITVPFAGTAFSFLLANIGFMLGILKAIFPGSSISQYHNGVRQRSN